MSAFVHYCGRFVPESVPLEKMTPAQTRTWRRTQAQWVMTPCDSTYCWSALVHCVRVVSFYKSKPYPIGSWYDLPGTAAAVMRMASMLWSVCNCNIFTRARIWASVPVLCMQVSATLTMNSSQGALILVQWSLVAVCSTFSNFSVADALYMHNHKDTFWKCPV